MEKMNHLKRVMAWVMTAAMLVSSCPTTAIADEVVSQVQKPVAQTLRSGETYGSFCRKPMKPSLKRRRTKRTCLSPTAFGMSKRMEKIP